MKNTMNRKKQFDQSKIIPAQPGWYACDALVSDDLSKCIGISYVPVIAWAFVESEEMQHGEVESIITLPIFAAGGPSHALSSLASENECCRLFYKDPDGCFSSFCEFFGSGEDAEANVIEAYTEAIKYENKRKNG